MRFGIMEMQIDLLVPQSSEPPDYRSAQAWAQLGFDHAAHTRRVAAAGFDLIELGGDLVLFFPQAYSPEAVERLAALKRELGLNYTAHLPLWSVEPSTPLTPVRHGSVRAAIDMIQATRSLEPEAYVWHATGALAAEFYRMRLPGPAHTFVLRQFQTGAFESIKTILGETGLPSRRLAIETIEFPLDLTLEIAEQLDLSLCLDTGHVLSGFSGEVEFFDAVERCLPRLTEVHLHDSYEHRPGQPIVYGRDHQKLGSGELDLGRFLDRLTAAKFNGPLIMELRIPETLASLDVIRAVRPAALDSG